MVNMIQEDLFDDLASALVGAAVQISSVIRQLIKSPLHVASSPLLDENMLLPSDDAF